MARWPIVMFAAVALGSCSEASPKNPFWPPSWQSSRPEEPVIRPYYIPSALGPAHATPDAAGQPRAASATAPHSPRPAATPLTTPTERKRSFFPVKLPFTNQHADVPLPRPPSAAAANIVADLVARAESLESQGRVDDARRLFDQALAMAPTDLTALLALAHLLDRQGLLEEATTVYQRAVAAHPHNPKPVNDLGLCLARRGMLPESAGTLLRAVELNPQNVLYRNNLATVLTEMGRPEEAYFHLAAAHGPAAGRYNLAILHHRRGNSSAAMVELQNALAADPAFLPARQWLSQMTPSEDPATGSALPQQSLSEETNAYGAGTAPGLAGRLPPAFPPRHVIYPGCPPTPCGSPSYLEEVLPIYRPSPGGFVGAPNHVPSVPQQPSGMVPREAPAPGKTDGPAAPVPQSELILQSPWPAVGVQRSPAAEAQRYSQRRY